MLEIHRKVRADEAVSVKKRKRKKRRKKRLPKSSSLTLCPHLVFWTVFYEPLAFQSMLGVYVPCGYLLIRQSWRLFGRFLRCLGCPGSTGNAFSWEMASRTRFCIQRNAWSLLHVMRQSTEFFVYVGTDPEVDSPALAVVFNAPDHFFHGPLYLTATGSVFGGGVQDHIQRFLVRQRIHARRQSTLCSKTSFYGPDSAENCRVLGQGDMPVVCKDRLYGPDSAENCSSYTGAVLGQGDMPVVCKTGFMAQTVPKTVELHRCSSWTR